MGVFSMQPLWIWFVSAFGGIIIVEYGNIMREQHHRMKLESLITFQSSRRIMGAFYYATLHFPASSLLPRPGNWCLSAIIRIFQSVKYSLRTRERRSLEGLRVPGGSYLSYRHQEELRHEEQTRMRDARRYNSITESTLMSLP